MQTANEYRCCRVDLYPSGTKPEAMEGHYIEADSIAEARKKMGKKFPQDDRFFVAFHKLRTSRRTR